MKLCSTILCYIKWNFYLTLLKIENVSVILCIYDITVSKTLLESKKLKFTYRITIA